MNSPKEIEPNGKSSSSKSSPARPLSVSARLAGLLDVIARKLGRLEPLMEAQPDLRQLTIVITLDRWGRPRTILVRTESKAELSS